MATIPSSTTVHYGTKPGHFESLKIHFPTSERCERTSERSGRRERSEQYGASEQVSGASEQVSGASERVNGRASDPVLTSLFLFAPDHSAVVTLALSPSTPSGADAKKEDQSAAVRQSTCDLEAQSVESQYQFYAFIYQA